MANYMIQQTLRRLVAETEFPRKCNTQELFKPARPLFEGSVSVLLV